MSKRPWPETSPNDGSGVSSAPPRVEVEHWHALCEEAFRTESLAAALRLAHSSLHDSPSLALAVMYHDGETVRAIMDFYRAVHPDLAANLKQDLVQRYAVGMSTPMSETVPFDLQGVGLDDDKGCRESGPCLTFPLPPGVGGVPGIFLVTQQAHSSFSPVHVATMRDFSLFLSSMLIAFRRIREVSRHDPLTGLLNRRGIQQEMSRAWRYLERYGGDLSMVSLDIDGFKILNDRYGHAVGDDLLREVAQRIESCVRNTDTVGRMGGDEINIILPGTNQENAMMLAQRILDRIRQIPFLAQGHAIHLSASAGTATCTPRDATAGISAIMRRADQALYVAKSDGRDRVCPWIDSCPVETRADSDRPTFIHSPPTRRSGRILVVDDEPAICAALEQILVAEGHVVVCEQGRKAAMAAVDATSLRFDVALVDVNLDGESGFELLEHFAKIDDTMVNIVMTGQATMENAISSLRAGAHDFITKPFNLNHLRATVQRALEVCSLVRENRNYQNQLENMVRARSRDLSSALAQVKESYSFTLNALSALLDAKEQATGEHSFRVSKLARLLASRMGLPDKMLDEIEHGALLHDIGKVAIPDAILLKPAPLTGEEWQIMRRHPEVGYKILASRPQLAEVALLVYQHQERYDGRGYPLGLKGEEICLGARIFAVVDSYDAMRSDRPYAASHPPEAVVREIVSRSGRDYDPRVVKVFQTCWPEFEALGKWPNRPEASLPPDGGDRSGPLD